MLFITNKKIVCSVLIGVLLVGLCQAYCYTGQSAQSASLALPQNIAEQQKELTKLLQQQKSIKKVLALIEIKRYFLKRLKWKRISYILFTITALCYIIFDVFALILGIIFGGYGLIIFCCIIVAIIWLGDILYNLYLITKKLKIHDEKMEKNMGLLTLIRETIGDIETHIQQINSQHKDFINSLKKLYKKFIDESDEKLDSASVFPIILAIFIMNVINFRKPTKTEYNVRACEALYEAA